MNNQHLTSLTPSLPPTHTLYPPPPDPRGGAPATRARSSPSHPLHAFSPSHSLASSMSQGSGLGLAQGSGLGLAQGSGLGLGLRGQLALAPVLKGLLQPREPRDDDHGRAGKGKRATAQVRGLGQSLPTLASPGASAVAIGMSSSLSHSVTPPRRQRNAQGHAGTRGLASSLSYSEEPGQGLGQGSSTSMFSGYMGYSVPHPLTLKRKGQSQQSATRTRASSVHWTDPTWLYDRALQGQKVVFYVATLTHSADASQPQAFVRCIREYASRDFAHDWVELVSLALGEEEGAVVQSVSPHHSKESTHGTGLGAGSGSGLGSGSALSSLFDHPVTASILYGKGELSRFRRCAQETVTMPLLEQVHGRKGTRASID